MGNAVVDDGFLPGSPIRRNRNGVQLHRGLSCAYSNSIVVSSPTLGKIGDTGASMIPQQRATGDLLISQADQDFVNGGYARVSYTGSTIWKKHYAILESLSGRFVELAWSGG